MDRKYTAYTDLVDDTHSVSGDGSRVPPDAK